MSRDVVEEKAAIATDLKSDILALQDRMDIMQLPILYCHAVRRRDAEELVRLFAANGTFWLDGTMGPGGLFSGEDLRAMYADGIPNLNPWPLTHNIHVTLQDRSHAMGVVHVEFRLGSQGYRVTHLGVYEDDYIKEDGVWKFRHRKLTATPVTQ